MAVTKPRKESKKSNEKPDWKKLQEIVAEIQREMAPGTDVQENVRVKGRTGRWRQLDVVLAQKIGADTVTVVFECKRYSRVVGIEKVEAFVTKLRDVRGTLGVMVSRTGFDAGARAAAADNNIILKTYREAGETDWESLLGQGAWLAFNRFDFQLQEARMILKDGQKIMGVPHNLILYKSDGSYYAVKGAKPYTFFDLFSLVWGQSQRPREIGEAIYFEFDQIDPPIFVLGPDGKLAATDVLILKGSVIPKRYAANVPITRGEVLEETHTHSAEYIKASTERFDPIAIMEAQEGTEYTQEEWQRAEQEEQSRFQVNLDRDDTVQIHFTGVRKDLTKQQEPPQK